MGPELRCLGSLFVPSCRISVNELPCEDADQAPTFAFSDVTLTAEELAEARVLADNIIQKIADLNLSLTNIVSDVRGYAALPPARRILQGACQILLDDDGERSGLSPCQLNALLIALESSSQTTTNITPPFLASPPPNAVELTPEFYAGALDLASLYFRIQRINDPTNPFHGAIFNFDEINYGGHLGAGDNNTYLYTESATMLALMFAYEISGDPRLLQEAEYGARFATGLVRSDGTTFSAAFDGYRPDSPTEASRRPGGRPLVDDVWGPDEWAAGLAAALFAKCAWHNTETAGAYFEYASLVGESLMLEYANDITQGNLGDNLQGFGGLVSYNLTMYQITEDPVYLERLDDLVAQILSLQTPEGYFAYNNQVAFQDYVPHLFMESLYELSQFYRGNNQIAAALEIEDSIMLFADHLRASVGPDFCQVRFLVNGELQSSVPLEPWMTGTHRGANSYILSSANVLAIAYQISGSPEYLNAAEDQMQWLFGRNPFGISMFTGIGENATSYHGRLAYDQTYSQISPNGLVPGGITNGIAERWGVPYYDLAPHLDEFPSWQSTSVWNFHTGWFMLAATRLSAL